MSKSIERPSLTMVQPAPAGGKAVVFVHGILSSHETFASMSRSFQDDAAFALWGIGHFDYDFWQKMPVSAYQLSHALKKQFAGKAEEVTLVCHSMGGLVARFAVLARGGEMPFLKRLVLLGTPNFGAIRPAQIGALAQMFLRATGQLYGTFTRKTGVIDLTRMHKQFAEFLDQGGGSPVHARSVEYVTIPGLYFHDERFAWDSTGNLASRALSVLSLGADWMVLAFPGAAVHVDRPHDGIVEASSVSLFTDAPGRWSEKHASIQDAQLREPPTCAHIEHRTRNRELTHVMIQQDETVIEIVKGILRAGSARAWRDNLGDARFDYLIRLPEG